jgi:peptidoglycan/LPS O-acetylase OafA/YrhL
VQAVFFFFFLSGLVLHLSLEGRPFSYPDFILRRTARIYLPYVVAMMLATVLLFVNNGRDVAEGSQWFRYPWKLPESAAAVLPHLNLLGTFDYGRLDPVVWSLTIEARVSLIFPLLSWMVRRLHWSLNLGVALACPWICRWSIPALEGTTWILTFRVLALFFFGALIAEHRGWIRQRVLRLGNLALLVLPFGAACYYLPIYYWQLTDPWTDYSIAFGAGSFVLLALGVEKVTKLLLHPALTWLGDVSYSLYLVHALVLLSLVHAFHRFAPIWLLLAAVPPISLAAAHVSWKLVELPSIALGRSAAKWAVGAFARPKREAA